MDILLSIFLFVVAFTLTLIGIPKKDDPLAWKSIMFMFVGGFIFVFLGFMILLDPIETISGIVTVENISAVNITDINTTFTFQQINTTFNSPLGIIFLALGAFVVLMAGVSAVNARE